MSEEGPDHWRTVLAANDERLSELEDTEDPVARREIVEALLGKGKALQELERFSEAIGVWDEIVRRLMVESVAVVPRTVFRALLNKAVALLLLEDRAAAGEVSDTLIALYDSMGPEKRGRGEVLGALLVKLHTGDEGSHEHVIAVDDEIIDRFGDSNDPVLRRQVTEAVMRNGLAALHLNNVDDAVQASVALALRLSTAPEATLVQEAEVATKYASNLKILAGTDLAGMMSTAAFSTVNIIREQASRLADRLGTVTNGWSVGFPGTEALTHGLHVTPAVWEDWRRRIDAALDLLEAVVSVLSGHPDPECKIVADIARIEAASLRTNRGEIARGVRELHTLTQSGDPATIQAFQRLAVGLRGRTDAPGQLTELSLLASRASALGQDDERITRIAYDDSVAPMLEETTHRPVRWMAALMRRLLGH